MGDEDDKAVSKRPVRRRDMARPKGKKYFSISVSVDERQKAWLDKRENASEEIRKVLDAMIEVSESAEAGLGAVILQRRLDVLEEEEGKLQRARNDHLTKYWGLWKKIEKEGKTTEYIDWEDADGAVPKPSPTEDALVALKVLLDYDKAIVSTARKITEVKREILSA